MQKLTAATLATATALWTAGCDSSTGPEPVIALTLSAPASELPAGDSLPLTATLLARGGRELDPRRATWSSTNVAVATVAAAADGRGVVAGVSPGTASIIAAADGRADTVTITVSPARVASLALDADSVVVRAFPLFYSVRVTATIRDRQGNVLAGRAITWTVTDTAIAHTVGVASASGAQIWGKLPGRTTLVATSEGRSDTVAVVVTLVPVGTVWLAGDTIPVFLGGQSAVVATVVDSTGFFPLAGRTITWESSDPGVARVSDGGVLTGVSVGITRLRATVEGKTATAVVVVADSGPSDFVAVAAGDRHSCGLARDGAAYCWGWNLFAMLGIGRWDTLSRTVPTPVAGGHRFASIYAGTFHSCALTTAGEAYCWGANDWGQLGTPPNEWCTDGPPGSGTACSPRPIAVAGGLRFTTLALGFDHTCGLTAGGAAHCWGANFAGQLGVGDSTVVTSSAPRAVTGGLAFRSLTAGDEHVCGLTAEGAAYCWGNNAFGQVGNGAVPGPPYYRLRTDAPAAVAGGHTFRALAADDFDSCGATAREVYCWGSGATRWLGEQPRGQRGNPVPVLAARNVSFTSLAMNSVLLCGLDAAAAAFCWGAGYLGDGSTSGIVTTPRRVAGGLAFQSLSARGGHSCGIAAGDRAYCWGVNRNGEVGNASRADAPTPARVLRR